MRRFKFILTSLLFLGLSSIGVLTLKSQDIAKTVEAVKEAVDLAEGASDNKTLYCRCKHGGCYGGNWISFRSSCAKYPNGTGNCRDWDSNCPSKE